MPSVGAFNFVYFATGLKKARAEGKKCHAKTMKNIMQLRNFLPSFLHVKKLTTMLNVTKLGKSIKNLLRLGVVYPEHYDRRGALSKVNQAITSDLFPALTL